MVVDVLEHHWKSNGRPSPLVEGRPRPVRPAASPNSRRFYDGDWADVLDLARSLALSKVLLEYGFPTSEDLVTDSTECLMEAVATIRKKPSAQLDDQFCVWPNVIRLVNLLTLCAVAEHRSAMVKIVSRHLVLAHPWLTECSDIRYHNHLLPIVAYSGIMFGSWLGLNYQKPLAMPPQSSIMTATDGCKKFSTTTRPSLVDLFVRNYLG